MKAQPEKSDSTLSTKSFIRQLVIIIVSIDFFVIGIAFFSLHQNYKKSEKHTFIMSDNLSLLLQEYLDGNISKIDMALLSCVNKIGPDLANGRQNAGEIEKYIKRERSYVPILDDLYMSDTNGDIIFGTQITPDSVKNVSDRDFFLRNKMKNSDQLLISQPVVSHITGKLSLVFSRRINYGNGSFAGVITGVISLEKLVNTFSKVDVGKNGIIFLRDQEFGLIARYPSLKVSSIGDRKVSKELVSMVESGRSYGNFKTAGVIDDHERILSFRKVGDRPLYIIVGLSAMDYLSAWHSFLHKQVLALLVFLTSSVGLGLYAFNDWKKRRKLIIEAGEQEKKFRIVAENTYDWEFWQNPQEKFIYISPSCERVTGYSREEFIKDPDLIKKIICSDDRPLYESHRDVINSVYKSEELTFRIVHADGSTRWIEHVCMPVFDDIGNYIGVRGSNRDITGRRKIEDAFKESQQMLFGIIDFLPDATVVMDNEKRVIAWNHVMEKMTGVSKEKVMGKLNYQISSTFYGFERGIFADLLDGENRELEQSYYNVKKIGDAIYGEGYAPALNNGKGSFVWIAASPLYTVDGKRSGSIEVMRDITEQKNNEKNLSEYTERLYQITENINEVFWLYDLEKSKIVYVNSAYERLWGCSCKKLYENPRSFFDYIHPDDRLKVESIFQKNSNGESSVIQYRIILPDGTVHWANGRIFPVFDSEGRIYRMAGIIHDITDRVTAEEALRESVELYRSTVNATPDALSIFDAEGTLLFISKQTIQMYGYSNADEIIGRNVVEWIDPADRDKAYEAMRKLLHGEEITDKEYRMIKKDGTLFIGETNGSILYGADGNIKGMVAITRDITDRKVIEAQLKKSVEEKDVLMKELQHRVKNNLNVIAGLLNLETKNLTDERARSIFINARSRIVSMSAIYERLYRSSDMDNIELGAYICELINFLIEIYSISKWKIRLNITCDEVHIDLKHAVPIGLIVNELISNALKYAFPQNESGEITVHLEHIKKKVKLTVADNGIGIPTNFNMESDATLGLRLVKLLSEQIGGKSSVKNGKGTTVVVEFTL